MTSWCKRIQIQGEKSGCQSVNVACVAKRCAGNTNGTRKEAAGRKWPNLWCDGGYCLVVEGRCFLLIKRSFVGALAWECCA